MYSLSSAKRSVYILPAYPAAALLLGAWWSGSTGREAPSRGELTLSQWATYATAILLGSVGALLIALALGLDLLAPLRNLVDTRDAANLALVEAIAATHRLPLAAGGAAILAAVSLLPRMLRNHSGDGAFCLIFCMCSV